MAFVLVNDSPTEEYPLERGLREGDPLSPFLFLLAAEGFNVLMKSLVGVHLFRGYHVGQQNEVQLTSLQFADDTSIIGEKSWLNVRSIRVVLLLFEVVSGLMVNFHKSILRGENVSDSWWTETASVTNCRTGTIPFMYLGFPIAGDIWQPVIDRILYRLSVWKSKFLSLGGRLILLKYDMSSLPIYFFFLLQGIHVYNFLYYIYFKKMSFICRGRGY